MAKKACPHCGAEYPETSIATLCGACGQPLDSAADGPTVGSRTVTVSSTERHPCENCGEGLYESETTCWKCGTAQKPETVATPPPRAEEPPPPPPPAAKVPPVTPPPATPASPLPPPPMAPALDRQLAVNKTAEQKGIAALIVGIIALLMTPAACCGCFGFVGAIPGGIAIWLGASAKKEGAGGAAQAGLVMGIIAVCISVVGGILGTIVMVASEA